MCCITNPLFSIYPVVPKSQISKNTVVADIRQADYTETAGSQSRRYALQHILGTKQVFEDISEDDRVEAASHAFAKQRIIQVPLNYMGESGCGSPGDFNVLLDPDDLGASPGSKKGLPQGAGGASHV